MKPVIQGLTDIYAAFSAEIKRHNDVFVLALTIQSNCSGRNLELQLFAGWYGLIGLHDAWSRFCRDVIITSAWGGILTRNGTRLSRSPLLTPHSDPINVLKGSWPKKGYGRCLDDGPNWYMPSFADKAAKILQIQNYDQFSAAILAAANAPSELRACRNYLAHRHPGTEQVSEIAVLRARIGCPTTDTEKLAEQYVTGGVTLFEDWCIELSNIAAAAIL